MSCLLERQGSRRVCAVADSVAALVNNNDDGDDGDDDKDDELCPTHTGTTKWEERLSTGQTPNKARSGPLLPASPAEASRSLSCTTCTSQIKHYPSTVVSTPFSPRKPNPLQPASARFPSFIDLVLTVFRANTSSLTFFSYQPAQCQILISPVLHQRVLRHLCW